MTVLAEIAGAAFGITLVYCALIGAVVIYHKIFS